MELLASPLRPFYPAVLMAFKAFEFRGVRIVESEFFAGSVAFHASRAAVRLNIPVEDIVGNARVTLSRNRIQQADDHEDEDNETYGAFHG